MNVSVFQPSILAPDFFEARQSCTNRATSTTHNKSKRDAMLAFRDKEVRDSHAGLISRNSICVLSQVEETHLHVGLEVFLGLWVIKLQRSQTCSSH